MVAEKIPIVIVDEVVRRLPYEGEELAACLFFLEALPTGATSLRLGSATCSTSSHAAPTPPGPRGRQGADGHVAPPRRGQSRSRERPPVAGGASSMTAWPYGEPEEDARGE